MLPSFKRHILEFIKFNYYILYFQFYYFTALTTEMILQTMGGVSTMKGKYQDKYFRQVLKSTLIGALYFFKWELNHTMLCWTSDATYWMNKSYNYLLLTSQKWAAQYSAENEIAVHREILFKVLNKVMTI